VPPPAVARPPRDGGDPADPVLILSVGRLVEKKGYADLLAALARLPPQLHWRFVHVGDGPLARRLRRKAARSGIAERITWLGPQPHDEVMAQYRRADLFVLACRTGRDGDRDGLPNVLLEAQSQGLACLSTTAGAVSELIAAGETGLLVPPGEAPALAAALERLVRSPRLRARLGAAGARRVRGVFASGPGLTRLAAKLGHGPSEQEPALAPAGAGAEEPAPCALRSTRR
jgi:glycosyltransferase involved in cell wall biosynthesis